MKPCFKIIYKNTVSLCKVIWPKKYTTKAEDKINVIYNLDCRGCESNYVGQTKRRVSMRVREHCRYNFCQFKAPYNVISTHFINNNHEFDFQNVRILDIDPNLIKEFYLK